MPKNKLEYTLKSELYNLRQSKGLIKTNILLKNSILFLIKGLFCLKNRSVVFIFSLKKGLPIPISSRYKSTCIIYSDCPTYYSNFDRTEAQWAEQKGILGHMLPAKHMLLNTLASMFFKSYSGYYFILYNVTWCDLLTKVQNSV